MRYELPRYIEEEAKIAGPLSIKQFFIFLGGGIASALYFYFLKTGLALLLSFLTIGGLGVVVFGKYKGRPISAIIISMVRYIWFPHTYVWEKPTVRSQDIYRETVQKPDAPQETKQEKEPINAQQLQDIAKKLDSKE